MQANKAEIVRVRISPEIKHSAEQVLASLGMSMSDAIRIFVSQVAIRQSFSVELRTPNSITMQSMQAMPESDEYASASALFDELNNAFELLANLPDDFMQDGREDLSPN